MYIVREGRKMQKSVKLTDRVKTRINNEIRGFIDAVTFLFGVFLWKEIWIVMSWVVVIVACWFGLALAHSLPNPWRTIAAWVFVLTPAIGRAIIWYTVEQ